MLYHTDDKGSRPCSAEKGKCPISQTDPTATHGDYADDKAAQVAYELRMEKKNENAPVSMRKGGLTKHSTQPRFAANTVIPKETMDKLVPRGGELEAYYASTDKKHFADKSAPGSKFTDPNVNKLEDVVQLAATQRGGLNGDDRQKLIDMGANPNAFNDSCRYLMVKTSGKVGSAPLKDFPEGTQFKAQRTKVGGSVSIVADVDEMPSTNVGVVVFGRKDGEGEELVFTAHPGLPSKSSGKDTFGPLEGQTLTKQQLIDFVGSDNINVNTALRQR